MKYILGVVVLFFLTTMSILLVTRERGGPEQTTGQHATRRVVLAKNAKPGTSVVLTTQGELVGEDERRAIRIKVSENERRLEILTGYNEAVERSFVFANTDKAYETFLIALDGAGYTKKFPEITVEDERGVCPQGKRYIYEFKEYSQQVTRLWDTSCSSKQGQTFGGSSSMVRQLFKAQIPDYIKLVKGVRL
jgi:hypothetical protein